MDPSLVIEWQCAAEKLAQLPLETDINMVNDAPPRRSIFGVKSGFKYNVKLNLEDDLSRLYMHSIIYSII